MSQITAVIAVVPVVLVETCIMRILCKHHALHFPCQLEHLNLYESSHIDCKTSLSAIHKVIKQWLIIFLICVHNSWKEIYENLK
jgi:hypothetical protein